MTARTTKRQSMSKAAQDIAAQVAQAEKSWSRGVWRSEVEAMKADMGIIDARDRRFSAVRDFSIRLAKVMGRAAAPKAVVSFSRICRRVTGSDDV